ncbi:hypothetical protein X946_5119 [Burkholderia sp. ABCPW 111]|nr:hypothetical protein X946_5119 [Burkholderia sp. ABCPW 111]
MGIRSPMPHSHEQTVHVERLRTVSARSWITCAVWTILGIFGIVFSVCRRYRRFPILYRGQALPLTLPSRALGRLSLQHQDTICRLRPNDR